VTDSGETNGINGQNGEIKFHRNLYRRFHLEDFLSFPSSPPPPPRLPRRRPLGPALSFARARARAHAPLARHDERLIAIKRSSIVSRVASCDTYLQHFRAVSNKVRCHARELLARDTSATMAIKRKILI